MAKFPAATHPIQNAQCYEIQDVKLKKVPWGNFATDMKMQEIFNGTFFSKIQNISQRKKRMVSD